MPPHRTAVRSASVRRQAAERARLLWPGRVWEPGVGPHAVAPALVTAELGGDARETHGRAAEPAGRLVQGDALEVALALGQEGLAGQVDLVYVDPPFASQASYVNEARLDGPAGGRAVRATAYDDHWDEGGGAYLEMLAPRLEALAHLLSPTGTLWVHVDWRASYLVRQVLDEVMGRQACINEIVWRRAPNLGRQAASHQFGRTLDTLVVYGMPGAKLVPPTRLEPIEPSAVKRDAEGRSFTTAPRGDYTDASIERLDSEGRVHRTPSGKVYIKYFLVKDEQGVWCRERRVDALWTDVPPLRHAKPAERTGFPTQKPRALLDRIVGCATPAGGLVVDLFGGSGTTGESAHALGRRFVLGDSSPLSLACARARLLRAGAPLVSQTCGAGEVAQGEPPGVDVERRGGSVKVTLREPHEPLAWAVGTSPGAGGPFRRLWHAERVPGAKVMPAARTAVIPHADGPLVARVWYDDGRVGTTKVAG
jgi:DNA modification methylase